MAVYRFSVKHGSRAKGTSARAHVSYILREERYEYGSHELRYTESGNLPEWAQENPKHFWSTADLYESANARLYTEFEVALPRELSTEQQTDLAKEFLKNEIGDRHAYTIAIHESTTTDGGVNPHFHLMFSTRKNDGIERRESLFFKRANSRSPEEGGAPKDRSWMPKPRLHELRVSWETHANRALEMAGVLATVDHRSLRDQGIDRDPQPKLTPMDVMLWKQGIKTQTVEQVLLCREIARIQAKQGDARETLSKLEKMGQLEAFGKRVGVTLERQESHLRSLVERRETADQIVDTLTEQTRAMPKTDEDALKEARTRLYGRAYAEHHSALKKASERFCEARERVQSWGQQPIAAILELPAVVDSFGNLLRLRQEFVVLQEQTQRYAEKMQSQEVVTECKRVADEILEDRQAVLAERDKALEVALKTRQELEQHAEIAQELNGIMAEVRADFEQEAEKLSPVLQQMIRVDNQSVEVGQKAEQPQIQARQEMSLGHRLKLSLSPESE